MIIGIVVFIFCALGIYGYYDGNMVLTYIGLVLAIIENIIGIYTGEARGFSTLWIAILCALGMSTVGNNLIESIAICICFENVTCFILGIILLLTTRKAISKVQKNSNNEIENLRTKTH